MDMGMDMGIRMGTRRTITMTMRTVTPMTARASPACTSPA
jgi:hypothetical protein